MYTEETNNYNQQNMVIRNETCSGFCGNFIPEAGDLMKKNGIKPIVGSCINNGRRLFPVFNGDPCINPNLYIDVPIPKLATPSSK